MKLLPVHSTRRRESAWVRYRINTATARIRQVAAGLAFAAGLIHLTMAPQTLAESVLHGSLLLAVGAAQIAAGGMLFLRPSPRLVFTTMVGSALLLVVYAVSRMAGLSSSPNGIPAIDIISNLTELALVGALATAALRGWPRRGPAIELEAAMPVLRAHRAGVRRASLVLLTAFTATALGPLPTALMDGLAGMASHYRAQLAAAQSTSFLETFDGNPSSPQPWNPANWDVTVHSRDSGTLLSLEAMNAQHGGGCEPPLVNPTIPWNVTTNPLVKHPVNGSYEGSVFNCKNHVMTAIQAGGYGLIYLTPNQMVDFSGGEAVIRWDMSTLWLTNGDWADVVVSPYDESAQLALSPGPDLQGWPRRAVSAKLHGGGGSGLVVRDFLETELPRLSRSYAGVLTPDPARRDTFELRISRTHIKFWMPQYNLVINDTDIPDLGWDRGVVQFGHHSYNPNKHCDDALPVCEPNTWHWDNVSINPAVPFTIIKADRRYISSTTTNQVAFAQPAPASSFLRFAGLGTNFEMSLDGGQTWQPVQRQVTGEPPNEGTFDSKWTSIPQGTTGIRLRAGVSSNGGTWIARDISLFSSVGGPAPAAQATSTPTTASATTSTPTSAPSNPTRTPTPLPPTATTAPASPTTATEFTCSQFTGFSVTNNWFAGAEAVLGSDRYQMLWNSGGAARLWADPSYAGWSQPLTSPCVNSSLSPDRVIMDLTHDAYLTAANTGSDPVGFMEGIIRNVIATIRVKHPGVRQIVLQPIVGGLSHTLCPWPGAEQGVVRASYNHPIIHQAALRVVGGDVVFGADPSVRTCADYADSVGHLNAGGPIGTSIGQFYVQYVGPVTTSTPASVLTRTATPLPSSTPVVAATATAIPVAGTTSSASPGTRVRWQGGNWYLQGANVPWYRWGCDFGCGPNGGGASSASVQSIMDSAFAQLRATGAHTVRWWVFPGDPWQITRDSAGAPTGLNPAVYADFDAALRLAEAHDLYLDFVLFSSPTAMPSAWSTDPTQRSRLVSALSPLFARYRGNPHLLSWEVFNEPEWDIWNGRIPQAPVQATVRAIADAVHANSTAYVTVGAARIDGLPLWVGLGLDYYQAHWYDSMAGSRCARCTDYASLRTLYSLDAPLVIGEFYAGADADALGKFEDFYDKGYAGAWAWSLLPDRTRDHMAIDMNAATTFGSQHTDLGPQSSTTPPSGPSATSTPQPAASPTSSPASPATATSTPVRTATPTRTSTPVPTATRQPSTTPTAIPAPIATGPTLVTFNDVAQQRPLRVEYPAGMINWQSNAWMVSGPWGAFTTNSVSFSKSSVSSGSFTFKTPRRLVSLQAYNGGKTAATVTFSCAGQPTKQVQLGAGQMAAVDLGWTGTCTTVNVATTNNWSTNFDNLVVY